MENGDLDAKKGLHKVEMEDKVCNAIITYMVSANIKTNAKKICMLMVSVMLSMAVR